MALKDSIRVLKEFPPNYAGEYVVCFGNVTCPDIKAGHVPENKLLHVPVPSLADVAAAFAVPPVAMVDGLLFLLDPEDSSLTEDDMALVKTIQKEFTRRYYKHVVFPHFSLATSDPHGVREQNPPEIVRLISKLENMPYLLRYPLAQKLFDQSCNMSVLLVLPGPSLAELAPQLPELAKHCVVVAVSRTLAYCLDNGVEPDFVVQLDTFLIQRHFFENIPPLRNTVLVTLSIAPVSRFASLFRGVLFMDSFNPSILPNLWRLRENPVSTLMACMGMAECLRAPQAIMCGVDLSFPVGKSNSSVYDGYEEGSSNGPQCLLRSGQNFLMSDRKGKSVHTLTRYLATAVEAEHYTKAINDAVGTQFYTIQDSGILSKEYFPLMGVEQVLNLPRVDREALVRKMDIALEQSEDVKYVRLKVDCSKNIDALNQNILLFEACRVQGPVEGVENNPIRLFADNIREFIMPQEPEARMALARKFSHAWRDASIQAHNLALAYMITRRGGDIPLLCLDAERETLSEQLEKLFSGFKWRMMPLANISQPKLTADPDYLLSVNIPQTAYDNQVLFVTPAAREMYDYTIDLFGGENLFFIKPYHLEPRHA